MNRLARLTLEEFIRTGALLALMVGCIFITVPFVMLTMYGPHAGLATRGLALLHVALVIAGLVHSLLYQAQHTWAVMRGRAKGILNSTRLSWRWQMGYFLANVLCLVAEWWWVKALQSAASAKAPVACADRCLSLMGLA